MLKLMTSQSAARSGQGTPMYSRRGKSTINNYLCFSQDPDEIARRRAQLVRQREGRLYLEDKFGGVDELTRKLMRL